MRSASHPPVRTLKRTGTHPEIDADRCARLVLGQPLLVREAKQEAALPDGRVADK